MSSHTCTALAHFLNTLLTLEVCGFPLASVYNSDSSNHVHQKTFFNPLSNIFVCISPLTKNVGAILIQNEDLNALQTTGVPVLCHSQ